MEAHKSPLERAFELARTGQFATLSSLVQRLSWEGYSASQIEGPQLKKQLNAVLHAAQAEKAKAEAADSDAV